MTLTGTAQRQEPVSCEKMPVGLCMDFAEDTWILPEYAPKNNRFAGTKVRIDFSEISAPAVKLLVKQYAAWRLGRVKPVTVRTEVYGRLSWWVRYLESRKISDPARFDARQMRLFPVWLQKKGMDMAAAQRTGQTAAQLIETGQRLGWRVTEEPVPGCVEWQEAEKREAAHRDWLVAEMPSAGCVEKRPEKPCPAPHTKEQRRGGSTQPIPDEIYRQILYHAVCDEKDMITKAGIVIQSQTGLRISEVLSLKEGCLSGDRNGGFLLAYESKKTQRAEPMTRFIPANRLVCRAVRQLSRETEYLRAESGRRELFLVKNHGIRPASATNWNRGRLHAFLERWAITGADGSVYPLHSHQFRATYVRRKLLAGTGIETVQRQFGHASAEMTAWYVHIETEELAAFLSPYLGVEKGGGGIDR